MLHEVQRYLQEDYLYDTCRSNAFERIFVWYTCLLHLQQTDFSHFKGSSESEIDYLMKPSSINSLPHFLINFKLQLIKFYDLPHSSSSSYNNSWYISHIYSSILPKNKNSIFALFCTIFSFNTKIVPARIVHYSALLRNQDARKIVHETLLDF